MASSPENQPTWAPDATAAPVPLSAAAPPPLADEEERNHHPAATAETNTVSMERHRLAVSKIAQSVAGFFKTKEPYRIHHGSTNTTRPLRHGRSVDISALDNVLSVDVRNRRCLVEPNVSMDKLIEHTLPHGLVPPIVMEFPGITCGGGFAGTGGESSSFRHGYFDDTVESVEVVLADGEVVRASRRPGENPDLFSAAGGSVGTLGVTTALELRLLEAKRYVRATYRRVGSVAEAVAAVKEEVRRPRNDYVDGILFARDHGVVVSGELTDEKPEGEPARTFSRAWDPWFYLHVQERTATLLPSSFSSSGSSTSPSSSEATVTEYIPLAEYLFRYDRGGFWVARHAFRYFWFTPFNRLTRWLLDDFLHTRMLYRALHASGQSHTFVVQDLALPFETAEEFVDYAAEEFGIWPLWLCPLRRREGPTFHPVTTPPSSVSPLLPSSSSPAVPAGGETTATTATAAATATSREPDPIDAEQMLNIGLWGLGPKSHGRFVQLNRSLESKLAELGGQKWLYAHTYYAEPDFWRAYGGRAWYDELRRKYRATGLPSVYDKVRVRLSGDAGGAGGWKTKVKMVWPVGGVYGLWKAIRSGDYWLHRKAAWKWKGEGEGKEEEGEKVKAD